MTWIGGQTSVNNKSQGYHGKIFAWLEANGIKSCFLVGEGKPAKDFFKERYPNDAFYSIDKDIGVEPDFIWDICKNYPDLMKELIGKVHSIVCQATIEHILDPTGAVRNLSVFLEKGGYMIVESCTKEFDLHYFPIDTCRLNEDWFKHLPELLIDLELVEYVREGTSHIALYRKK